jgi:hypothetical protein
MAALSLVWVGCLSSSYRIAQPELSRLARVPPNERWQAVRATQRMLVSDAPPTPNVLVPSNEVVIVPSTYFFQGTPYNVPGSWRVHPSRWASQTVGTAASESTRTASSGGSAGGSRGEGRGRDTAVAVVVVVVAAALVVFVLAGTEGARYDGWFGLPPDELVYVDEPDGTITAVPLAAMTPELADRSRGGVVYEGREGRYLRLGRAPLDRVGFTVSSGPVAATIPHVGREGSGTHFGFGGRAFLGGFVVQQLGLGLTADVIASTGGQILAGGGIEAQVMPLTHVGSYLGAGGYTVLDDGPPSQRFGAWYARAGLQFELPLTTRLTAQLRLGASRIVPTDRSVAYVPEASVGMAVY